MNDPEHVKLYCRHCDEEVGCAETTCPNCGYPHELCEECGKALATPESCVCTDCFTKWAGRTGYP